MSLLFFLISLLTVGVASPLAVVAKAHNQRPASVRGAAIPPNEYHFDALRIDGQLQGPEALVVRSQLDRGEGPVLQLKRSFLHRVYETIEAPALHGDQ